MDITAGIEQVLRHQELGDVVLGKAVAAGAGGVHLHGDLLGNAAADGDLGDAVDTLQGGGHGLLREVLQLAEILTDEGHHGGGHQVGEVHIHDDGVQRALRQGQRVKLFPQLHGRHIQVRAIGVGDLELADAVGGGRADALHAGNRHHRRLQGAGQKLLHVAGGGAVIIAVHNSHRRLHVRQKGHLELGGEHRAEHGDHDDRQNGGHLMLDTEFGAAHGHSPPTTRTALPSTR